MQAKKKVKVTIKVNHFINDIRSGMSDIDLMGTYGLSAKGLQGTFRKLVEGNFIGQAELDRRAAPYWDTADLQNMRLFPRCYPALSVTVRDLTNPASKGLVTDITERGVGTRGLVAKADETRILELNPEELEDMSLLTVEVRCRWGKLDRTTGSYMAGFEISRISDESLRRLNKLIQEMTFSD